MEIKSIIIKECATCRTYYTKDMGKVKILNYDCIRPARKSELIKYGILK